MDVDAVSRGEVTVTLSAADPLTCVLDIPNRSFKMQHDNVMKVGRASSVPEKGFNAAIDNAWFSSPIMSREHAELSADLTKKAIFITDRKSLHGTFVNQKQLQTELPWKLQDGDRIEFGVSIERGVHRFSPTSFRVGIHFASTSAPATQATQPRVFRVPEDDESSDLDTTIDEAAGPSPLVSVAAGQHEDCPAIIDLTSPWRESTPHPGWTVNDCDSDEESQLAENSVGLAESPSHSDSLFDSSDDEDVEDGMGEEMTWMSSPDDSMFDGYDESDYDENCDGEDNDLYDEDLPDAEEPLSVFESAWDTASSDAGMDGIELDDLLDNLGIPAEKAANIANSIKRAVTTTTTTYQQHHSLVDTHHTAEITDAAPSAKVYPLASILNPCSPDVSKPTPKITSEELGAKSGKADFFRAREMNKETMAALNRIRQPEALVETASDTVPMSDAGEIATVQNNVALPETNLDGNRSVPVAVAKQDQSPERLHDDNNNNNNNSIITQLLGSPLLDAGDRFLNTAPTVQLPQVSEVASDDVAAMNSAASFVLYKQTPKSRASEEDRRKGLADQYKRLDDQHKRLRSLISESSLGHHLDDWKSLKRRRAESDVDEQRPTKRVSTAPVAETKITATWAVAEKLGYAALGGAMVLGSLIYTAPSFT